jgi:predicted dehydrogenase
MNESNKICVVGGGYWGKNHIKTLNELGALGGIVDSNKETLLKYKATYPDLNLYQSINDALNKNNFSGFIIATPAKTHFKLAKIIISNSKSVLVEKPFALDLEEAKEMVSLSKKHKVNLMVGHLLLFHPAIIKIKQIIDKGEIGKLHYMYSNRVNLGKVRSEENVFWSLAPHDISIFQYLTKSFPNEISAKGSNFIQNEIFDSTISYFKYPNNIDGHIFSSWLHPFKEHRLVIIGSEGMICFTDSDNNSPLLLYPNKIDISNGIPNEIKGNPKEINYESEMPLKKELEYFISNLNSSDIKKANAKHALEVTKIMVKVSKELKR